MKINQEGSGSFSRRIKVTSTSRLLLVGVIGKELTQKLEQKFRNLRSVVLPNHA